MPTCQTCGRQRNGTAKFCTGCGAPFPEYDEIGNAAAKGGTFASGSAQAVDTPITPAAPAPPNRSKRPSRPILIAALVLVAAVAGSGSWLLVRPTASHPRPGSHTAAVPAGSSASANNASVAVTPSPSPSPSTESVGTVAVASAEAQAADAPGVADFLNRYFAAINAHDYQSYAALLDSRMRQDFTASQFDSGYQSTSDSAETLVSTSAAANGDTIAMVTFTSHQNAAESVNHQQSCTNWQISLFLENDGTGYLIGPPPAGYHASYAACP